MSHVDITVVYIYNVRYYLFKVINCNSIMKESSIVVSIVN